MYREFHLYHRFTCNYQCLEKEQSKTSFSIDDFDPQWHQEWLGIEPIDTQLQQDQLGTELIDVDLLKTNQLGANFSRAQILEDKFSQQPQEQLETKLIDEGLYKDQFTTKFIYRLEEEFVFKLLKIKGKGTLKAIFQTRIGQIPSGFEVIEL